MDLKEKNEVVTETTEKKRVKKPLKKPSKSKFIIMVVAGIVVVAVVAFFLIGRLGAKGVEVPQITIPLSKSDITSSISVSGVVKSEETTNIYSNQTAYPIKKINVKVGDSVKAGDVLAELDMSKLQNDINQTEINLESAMANAQEEDRTRGNSITNARTSLESSQIALAKQQLSTANAEKDLAKAQSEMTEPFDSYTYDNTIRDAQTTLERKNEDLKKAEEDLDEALYKFDDYTYQNAIKERSITLDRKLDDLADAQKTLNDAKDENAFDDYSYLNTLYDRQVKYDRAWSDYRDAKDAYSDAKNSGMSKASLTSYESALNQAERTLEDAETNLQIAENDYDRALDKGNDSYDSSVETAQKAVRSAQNQVDDARDAYNKAIEDLERAKRDAATNAYDALVKAQNAVDDAQRSYEKALSDKEHAITDYLDKNQTSLENAQKTAADSQKQLQSAQSSLKSAQNSLSQAQAKPDSSGTNVALQELNLDKLNNQLAEGKIIATVDGVITEMNAKVGANPSGILFVIEDVDDLYVSAKVKEYNLASIEMEQNAIVTTDATGDKVYGGAISYISPKAVSEAGSTSVEFEIQASITEPDNAVKIGMNAFLNIVIDSKSNVYVVPLSMITTDPRGSFVSALEDGVTKEIPVTVGLKNSTNAEVSGDGLYDGMQLLADPSGSMTAQRQTMASGGMMFGG